MQEYDRKRLLGTGGFSQVYEAVCRNTSSTVALKIVCSTYTYVPIFRSVAEIIIRFGLPQIEKNVIKKQSLRNRVLQEINIQCLLNHPSILKLLTAFEDENYVCIVLEYCSEGDLANIVKRGISTKDGNPILDVQAFELILI